jgi:hypothetical protein
MWKARDRLLGAVASRVDDELLTLLGDVHFAMGDLPAAGAVWAGVEQGTEPAVDPTRRAAADAAWRERHGDDPLQLWLSLPPLVRDSARTAAVRDLHREAVAAAAARRTRGRGTGAPSVLPGEPTGWTVSGVVAVAVVLGLLGLAAVGAWTVFGWLLG